jgi:diguanylate cyclase (GGDEF)-like protein
MELDRRLAREMAPFGVATLLGFALVPIGLEVDWTGYVAAALLMAAIFAAAAVAPWRSLPRAARVVPPLLFLVAVALLREASGGAAGGVGALALVPVFWLALYGTRGQLAVLVAGVCVLFVVPAFAAHPEYPHSIWRMAVVFAAASALAGFAVQSLVGRVRGHAAALAVRERDLESMADLTRSLSAAPDARDRICAAACELSGAHFAVLLEYGGALELTAAAGLPAAGPIDEPAAVVAEPVHRGAAVVGMLVAGWRQPPPDARRTRGLIRLLASEAAFVIERADLLGRLTEFAMTDELTGLPNRRAANERIAQAVEHGEPVCLAILDLDHFKDYNDDHGHQAGDRLLKEAAAAWRASLRPADLLARYGGEEFVLLLQGTDLAIARAIVDRLRAATPRGQSCSAGVALRADGEPAASLLERADAALYEAKRAGRNRTLIAGGR